MNNASTPLSRRFFLIALLFVVLSVQPGVPAVQSALNIAAVLDAGATSTCALTMDGIVFCWGNNDYGQLGGSRGPGGTGPVRVYGLPAGVKAISTGVSHNCAITPENGVKCWGYNYYGQLGNGKSGSYFPNPTPVQVSGLTSGVAAVSAGGYHTCALTLQGGVKCWGYNFDRALGDGTTYDHATPVDVLGLTSGVIAISAGGNGTCALTEAGGVKCWGFGYLATPTDVPGLTSGVIAIAVGNTHECALTTAGGVKCWGNNSDGQLGNGTTVSSLTPVDVLDLTSGVKAIAAGGGHTCALTSSGGLKCWGANTSGQVGNNTTARVQNRPADVVGLSSRVIAISAGGGVTCALMRNRVGKCWGYNKQGQIGNGDLTLRTSPTDVVGLSSAVSSVSVSINSCALINGTAKCWGKNMSGEVGDGTRITRTTPVDVVGLGSDVQSIANGVVHTCALTSAGGVKCWGYNLAGQLGDGTTVDHITPMDVVGLTSGVAALVVRSYHTCAITVQGGLKCWGQNTNGELGDGTTTNRLIPTDVVGLTSGVTAVSLGEAHACALTTGGGVKCWGQNGNGKLGDGTTANHLTPVDVTGLTSGARAISTGFYHTCAITAVGGVKCWGDNMNGQLGFQNSITNSLVPVDVSGLASGVTAITSGLWHNCALTNGGTPTGGGIKCWGENSAGQLGDGTSSDRDAPVNVVNLSSGVVSIAAGEENTCAVTTAGGLKCWGDDTYGQLGDGRLMISAVPINVVGLDPIPVYTISGVVTGSAGPLSGVTVTLTGPDGQLDQIATGTAGSFTIQEVISGNYTLQVNKTDYVFSPNPLAITVSSANVSGLSFQGKYKPASLTGTVTISGGTSAGVTLTLSQGGQVLGETVTSVDGSFGFADIESGSYVLTPSQAGVLFTPSSRQVQLTGENLFGIDFAGSIRPAALSGSVRTRSGSSPIAGATISLRDKAGLLLQEQQVAENGAYAFPNLEAGVYTLAAAKPGYRFTPASIDVSLAGLDISGLSFEGEYTPATLSGTVWMGAEPLAGVTVTADSADGTSPAGSVVTGQDGAYAFSNLKSGSYTITVRKSGYLFTPESREAALAGQDISGLDFSGQYAPAGIDGYITIGFGDSAGVTVSLWRNGGLLSQQVTGKDGAFAFPALSAGSYTLTAVKTNYVFTPPSCEVTLAGQAVNGLNFTGEYQGMIYLPVIIR